MLGYPAVGETEAGHQGQKRVCSAVAVRSTHSWGRMSRDCGNGRRAAALPRRTRRFAVAGLATISTSVPDATSHWIGLPPPGSRRRGWGATRSALRGGSSRSGRRRGRRSDCRRGCSGVPGCRGRRVRPIAAPPRSAVRECGIRTHGEASQVHVQISSPSGLVRIVAERAAPPAAAVCLGPRAGVMDRSRRTAMARARAAAVPVLGIIVDGRGHAPRASPIAWRALTVRPISITMTSPGSPGRLRTTPASRPTGSTEPARGHPQAPNQNPGRRIEARWPSPLGNYGPLERLAHGVSHADGGPGTRGPVDHHLIRGDVEQAVAPGASAVYQCPVQDPTARAERLPARRGANNPVPDGRSRLRIRKARRPPPSWASGWRGRRPASSGWPVRRHGLHPGGRRGTGSPSSPSEARTEKRAVRSRLGRERGGGPAQASIRRAGEPDPGGPWAIMTMA